jgi:hypothetical protein
MSAFTRGLIVGTAATDLTGFGALLWTRTGSASWFAAMLAIGGLIVGLGYCFVEQA